MGTRVGREVHGEEEEKGGRARHEGSWRVMKNFSSFTRCSRRVFLCTYSELDDGKDGVRVLRDDLLHRTSGIVQGAMPIHGSPLLQTPMPVPG